MGVAQEARDHSYFRTPSVVNKVHPDYSPLETLELQHLWTQAMLKNQTQKNAKKIGSSQFPVKLPI